MEARVITLAPTDEISGIVSFEDAFGEFSEARGKRQVKKTARKTKKHEERAKRKTSKIASRNEVKTARKQTRIARRSDAQAARGEMRQNRKNTRVSGRLGRRTARQETRQSFRDMKNAPDPEMEMGTDMGYAPDQYYDESGYPSQDQYTDDQYYGQSDQYDQDGSEPYYDQPVNQGDYYEEPSYDEGEYYEEEEQPYYEETPYDYGNDETIMDDPESYGEGDYMGEDSFGDMMPFDGIMGAEDRFNEMQENVTFVPVTEIEDLSNKLEWNKEKAERLAKRIAQSEDEKDVQELGSTKQRIQEIMRSIDDYANCCGNYSSADGSAPSNAELRNRRAEIFKARKKAKQARANIGKKPTRVSRDLKPEISRQRIVIPSESKSNATGLNGIDLAEDFDAPRIREIQLGADGSSSTTPKIGLIVLGVAAGITIAYLIHKHKPFKSLK